MRKVIAILLSILILSGTASSVTIQEYSYKNMEQQVNYMKLAREAFNAMLSNTDAFLTSLWDAAYSTQMVFRWFFEFGSKMGEKINEDSTLRLKFSDALATYANNSSTIIGDSAGTVGKSYLSATKNDILVNQTDYYNISSSYASEWTQTLEKFTQFYANFYRDWGLT
jgi:hypothetical protein